MSWPYVHLLVNHFPVILAVVGTAALLPAWLTSRRTVWLYALVSLTLAGLSVWPVHQTGDEADHVMGYQWYVDRRAIHEHEEAADKAMYSLLITGALAAYGWWLLTRRGTGGTTETTAARGTAAALPLWLRGLVTAGALMGAAAIARTSHLGGNIVYESPALRGQGIGLEDTLAVRPPNAPRGSVAPMPPARDSQGAARVTTP